MKYIDFSQPSLWISICSILFNPLYWNIVARQEYKNKLLTRLAGGKAYLGCYVLAVTIFTLGILRDKLYHSALSSQPTYSTLLHYTEFKIVAIVSGVVGSTLVMSSMWALGVTGTYLGDYFGILMDEKVESFPFNVTSNPMYYGSTLIFFAYALWYESPAGFFLTALVFVVYKIALRYEEPFTGEIYAKRERERAAAKKNGKAIEDVGSSSAIKSGGGPSQRRHEEL